MRAGSSLPGAGTATDNAALIGLGPFDVAAGGTVTVRIWLLAAPDEALEAELSRQQARGAPPKRGLSLESFDLDPARIRTELSAVFQRYGF